MMAPLEDLPWILVGVAPGGRSYEAFCQVCHARFGGDEESVNRFADQHANHQSASPTHIGAGDLLKGLASRLGFTKPCTPCEERRLAMNRAVPHVPFFRR